MGMNLNKMLETAKKGVSSVTEKPITPQINEISSSNIEGFDIESLLSESETQVYNPSQDLKRMSQPITEENIKNSKLPKTILETMLKNPIDIPILAEEGDNNFLTEEMKKKNRALIEKFNAMDKIPPKYKKMEEFHKDIKGKKYTPNGENNGIVGSINKEELLKEIEKIIEDKLQTYTSMIIKSCSTSMDNLSVMKIGENFIFIDDDNNVYDCKLTKKKAKAKIK